MKIGDISYGSKPTSKCLLIYPRSYISPQESPTNTNFTLLPTRALLNKKRKTISFGVLKVGFPSEKLFVTNPY